MELSVETVRTRAGHFVILKNPKDRTSCHMRGGGYERWMHSIIDSYRDDEKIAIDVGASFGFHSFAMSRNFGRVISFEPQAGIANLLARSCFLNGKTNIEVINAFCSDKNGSVDFPVIDYDQTTNVGAITIADGQKEDRYANTGWDGESYTAVPSITIDDYLDGSSAAVGFIKIDVDGSEYKVLKGAQDTLTRNLCPLIIEIRDIPEGNRQKVHELLFNIGYNTVQNVGNSEWDFLCTSGVDYGNDI